RGPDGESFGEYFAVKATPNPHVVDLLRQEGCGADCSSPAELVMCDRLGIRGTDVMFTSNNTTASEFQMAIDLGAIVNLDTPDHLQVLKSLPTLPDVVSFRFNPGAEREGNVIIGDPKEAKFGCTRQQIVDGYAACREMGIQKYGLHAMVVSNELSVASLLDTAAMLFELAVIIHQQTGVRVDFINLGGGIGVAYHPDQTPPDIAAFGAGVEKLYNEILGPAGLTPTRLMMENGRCMTGPYGYLITSVINKKHSYKHYVGVDACMSNLMRPGMYGAYHHISVLGRDNDGPQQTVDVVGSLCENNDKFAIDRQMIDCEIGDLLVIHDAGAHGHSMGFQYNGRLRSAELMLHSDGRVSEIRRAETLEDLWATVDFEKTCPVPVQQPVS
ncbi:MAG: diaminopimelate decarboxylase, partial [Planctomycetota bacterium]